MGAALIVKPTAQRNFSVLSFGVAQLAMDIEPMVGMIRNSDILHGPSHTVLGALLIAFIVAWMAPPICNLILRRYNLEVRFLGLEWLQEPHSVTRTAVMTGAFFGTLSHIILDSLMHFDIHPLAPFSDANPLLNLVSVDGVYQLCTVAVLVGVAAWLVLKWMRRGIAKAHSGE
jgi:hypothetical protein